MNGSTSGGLVMPVTPAAAALVVLVVVFLWLLRAVLRS
jgi:hypothetical protein